MRNVDCPSGVQIYGRIISMSQIRSVYLPNTRKAGASSVARAKKWMIPHDIRSVGKKLYVTTDIPRAKNPRRRVLCKVFFQIYHQLRPYKLR